MARLKKVIGNSKVLYLGAVAHCRLHYTEHAYVAVCSLRSQLLMALHDEEQTDLCATDRCHRLAWLVEPGRHCSPRHRPWQISLTIQLKLCVRRTSAFSLLRNRRSIYSRIAIRSDLLRFGRWQFRIGQSWIYSRPDPTLSLRCEDS